MKCNHCKYVDGWDPEILDHIDGDHGHFFRLPVEMERPTQYYGTERRELVGCPKCGNTQIEVN